MKVGPARTLIPVLAILALAAALGWYFYRERMSASNAEIASRTPPQAEKADGAAPAVTPPPPSGGDAPAAQQQSAALPPQPHVPTSAEPKPAEAPQPRPGQSDPKPGETVAEPKLPSFDVVRVEPTGDSVIAGRASPNATVELLRNGQPFARVVADASGLFAFVPPPLPAGSHEIVLQATSPEGGGRARSAQSVTVVIASDRKQTPLVTVTAPDQPTVVLSKPEDPPAPPAAPSPAVAAAAQPGPAPAPAPAPATPSTLAAGPAPAPAKRPDIRIATVEAEGTGRLFVSGQAAPGATIRLYLNDAFVAPSGTGPDGRLSFSIERGIRPGDYRVRLDDVDPVTGAVKSRAEVPFTVPAPPPVAVAAAPAARPAGPAVTPSRDAPAQPEPRTIERQAAVSERAPTAAPSVTSQPPAGGATTRDSATAESKAAAPGTAIVLADPGQVVVPEVNTTIVARGDNLWRISKRVYGQGLRYTVIYGANTPQIRDPDLIYPGQVFVLPADEAQKR